MRGAGAPLCGDSPGGKERASHNDIRNDRQIKGFLSGKDDDLQAQGEIVAGYVELGARFDGSLSHFFEEVTHRLEVAFAFVVFVMHGNDDLGFDFADGLGSHRGVNCGNAADRHHQNIDVSQLFNLFIREYMADIAEVTNIDSIYFHEIDSVFALRLAFYSVVEGGDAKNQDAADFIFAGSFDEAVLGINALVIGMGGMRVADSNDIGGLLAEGIAETGRKGVGNDDCLTAADAETGVT